MIDITLLKILKYRKYFKQMYKALPKSTLDDKTDLILKDFGKYFDKFDHDCIDLRVFLPRFRSWHNTMDEEVFNTYVAIIRKAQEDVDDTTRIGVLSDLYEIDAVNKLADLCYRFEEGELEAPITDLVSNVVDTYKLNVGARVASWNNTDIGELLKEDLNNDGIVPRLKCLRESMRPFRGGDFGIIAGRPDRGKTTFVASEITYMASQLDQDRNVLWLNNEGMSSRIVKRLYQAALGKTITECVQLNEHGKLKSMYEQVVGRLDKIRVFDIHGYHIGQVEAILENNNPGIIVYDMIDIIRGFGSEARTDLALEAMYQWGRERSVKYDAVGFATSQISADGDGLQFPGLSMLKDSKTGKQGACDFQIMIGASNAPELQNTRYIGVPKNKLHRDGFKSDPRAEVFFNASRARYEDIKEDIC